MKKVIVLLLSLMTAITINTTAIAEDESNELWPGFQTTSTDRNTVYEEISNYLLPKCKSKFLKFKNKSLIKHSPDHYKKENVALLYIEMTLLKDSIEKENQEKLKDFLAVEQYRNAKVLSNYDKQYENADAIMQGVTYYVTSKAIHLSESDVIANFPENFLPLNELYGRDDRIIETMNYVEEFITGIACYELDKLDPQGQWKNEANSKLKPPVQILQQHYGKFSAKELNERLNKVKNEYDYLGLLKSLPNAQD